MTRNAFKLLLVVCMYIYGAGTQIAHAQTVPASEVRMTSKAAPAPLTGAYKLYVDTADGTFHCLNPSGTSCMPAGTGGGGIGTVTSVGLAVPGVLFTVSGSPITGAGSFTFTLINQNANTFLAGPATGIAAAPGFRSIVAADIPTLNQSTTGNAATATALDHNPADCAAGSYATGVDATGAATGCTVAPPGTVTSFSAGNLSPLFTSSVANPTTTPSHTFTLSTAAAHTFLGNNTGATAAPAYVQPAFSDLSGVGSCAQEPAATGDITSSGCVFTLATVATPATATKITFNAKGLVTAGATAAASDLSNGVSGSGAIPLAFGATTVPRSVDNVIYAESFNLGNWCDDVNAAVTAMGTKAGEIVVSKAAGTACGASIALNGNSLRFIDYGDFSCKGITVANGGLNITGLGLSDKGSSTYSTRLIFVGTSGTDMVSVLGTAGARLDKVTIGNILLDGNNTARYVLRLEKIDGGTINNVRMQGGQVANEYVVDAIDWKYYNVGWTFCQGNAGTGVCAIFDWGSGNTHIYGGQTEQGASSTGVQFILSGAINTFKIDGMDFDSCNPVGGFMLIQGQDANSAFASAPTGGTGKPINVFVTGSVFNYCTGSTAAAQGADVLVTDATSAQQPTSIVFANNEFLGSSIGAVAVKADQSQNVKVKDSFSNGHTSGTYWATSNALNPQMTDTVSADTARGVGTIASICDEWVTTGLHNYNCNQVWNQPANKLGQASIIADSAAINTTETIVVKTPALAANRVIAGTTIRIPVSGTCTSTAANTQTFTVRWGTAGTTADTAMATFVTGSAATSGTTVPWHGEILLTIRTVGASATATGDMTMLNSGVTGCAIVGTQVILPTLANFNSTTASAILSLSYKTAATTTTSIIKQAPIEIVYQ
jgi:hypothetical protein